MVSLSADQVDRFIADGFVKLEDAFPRETAAACADILWREMGLSPDRPEQWTRPVVRLGMHAEAPFREAATSPRLYTALDQLVGKDRWIPPASLGAMVVRFPAAGPPGDDGWHIDASFPPDDDPTTHDYFQWRVNAASRARALLMLFLFSDCGPDDAPTRIRVGSHLPMAQQLLKHGEAGISLADLAREGFDSSADCDIALATGDAGTVWLLHPFTVHAAQAHHGSRVRFLAQPALGLKTPFQTHRPDGDYSPVEQALRRARGAKPRSLAPP